MTPYVTDMGESLGEPYTFLGNEDHHEQYVSV